MNEFITWHCPICDEPHDDPPDQETHCRWCGATIDLIGSQPTVDGQFAPGKWVQETYHTRHQLLLRRWNTEKKSWEYYDGTPEWTATFLWGVPFFTKSGADLALSFAKEKDPTYEYQLV